ncbi:MAG: GNAT family N-acetyltransferase [Pseudomonadota bacterium]
MTHDALSLRPLSAGDRAPLVAIFDDWDVIRMTSTFPVRFDAAFADQLIARFAGFDGLADAGWAVDFEDALAGTVSLHRQAPGVYELAYALGRAYWGRGLATRIARLAVDHAAGTLRARRLVASVYHDNPASMRVLEKLGFRATGEANAEPNQVRPEPEPVLRYALDLDAENPA